MRASILRRMWARVLPFPPARLLTGLVGSCGAASVPLGGSLLARQTGSRQGTSVSPSRHDRTGGPNFTTTNHASSHVRNHASRPRAMITKWVSLIGTDNASGGKIKSPLAEGRSRLETLRQGKRRTVCELTAPTVRLCHFDSTQTVRKVIAPRRKRTRGITEADSSWHTPGRRPRKVNQAR
jgi:hypothetical protein